MSQRERRVQLSQRGLRAVQTARPWSTIRWQKSLDFSGGRQLPQLLFHLQGVLAAVGDAPDGR